MMSMKRKATAAVLFAAAMLATPANAQTEGASISALTTCAGAIAAHANIDVVNYPRGASGEWSPVLGRILTQLNTMEGVEGMTGRYAASAARSYWVEQPTAERRTAATECRQRFGG